jgi:hypothetical protein
MGIAQKKTGKCSSDYYILNDDTTVILPSKMLDEDAFVCLACVQIFGALLLLAFLVYNGFKFGI